MGKRYRVLYLQDGRYISSVCMTKKVAYTYSRIFCDTKEWKAVEVVKVIKKKKNSK